MLVDLILKNRTYRRFDNNYKIEDATLIDLINLARISSSAKNGQSLKFLIINGEKNDLVFETLKWAGALKDWDGPIESEKPVSYILIVYDTTYNYYNPIDVGIATQSIMLGATELGLGGCQFGAFNKPQLHNNLGLVDNYDIKSVLAIGKPSEKVHIVSSTTSTTYYRDGNNHYVPKRPIKDIIEIIK